MRRAALAIVAPAALIAAVGSGGAVAATVCHPHGSTTVVAAHSGRVYTRSVHHVSYTYGCLYSTGHAYRLEHRSASFGDAVDATTLRLRGPFVAYSDGAQGIDTHIERLIVKDLRTGHNRHDTTAVRESVGVEEFDDVRQIVLKADGAAAWTVHASSIGGHSDVREVNSVDHNGARELDSGGGIALRSLRLHVSTLSWIDGGVTKHAQLR